MPKKNKSSVMIVSKPSSVQEVTEIQTVSTRRASKRSSRRRRRGRRSRGMNRVSAAGSSTAAYLTSLVDPFDNPGCKLGWGCLVPTQVVSVYRKTAIAANADGSLAVVATPAATNLLYYNNAGANTATWLTGSASDQAVLAANFGSGRPVSLGIRAFPNVAATAAPGEVAVGAAPAMSHDALVVLTPSDLISQPTSHIYRGYEGGSSAGRPQDTYSFEFIGSSVDLTGWTGNTIMPFSLPYISFVGLPASTTVYVEVVLNLEVTYAVGHALGPLGQGQQQTGPSLSDEWASLESMWSKVANAIPTPGQAGEAAASVWNNALKSPLFGQLVNGAARGARRRTPGGGARGFISSALSGAMDSFLAGY